MVTQTSPSRVRTRRSHANDPKRLRNALKSIERSRKDLKEFLDSRYPDRVEAADQS